MSLTNYIGQSAIGLIAFSGIGFGLAGALSPLALAGFVAVTFAAQVVVSALWLRRFRYGPLEWALRWLTNGQRPALVARDLQPA
jgi:uncharacterized protein